MYKKCIFDVLQFLMILHFLVLQCTTNGVIGLSNLFIIVLHVLRSILNPIFAPYIVLWDFVIRAN